MKTLFAATLIGLAALTATAATTRSAPVTFEVDDALVNAKIDARQNQLMKSLLSARQSTRLAQASR